MIALRRQSLSPKQRLMVQDVAGEPAAAVLTAHRDGAESREG
jgi:hypothetical protein